MRANKSLAQLSFSTAAVRSLKRIGNKIQIRIDNDQLFLKPTNRQRPAADVLALVRRKIGTQADLAIDPELSDPVLQTLTSLGYTPEQPYFMLEPMARHWLAVQHVKITEPPTSKEIFFQVMRPPVEVSAQVTETIRLIEHVGQYLESLRLADLRQVLPPALGLAQDIARHQYQINADGLPASLRQFLSDETLIGSDGAEFDRRVSAWASQSDEPPPPPKVSVGDVKRAITGLKKRYLSDEEANRIIAGFMEG
jgi:hypothetical protein